MFIIGNCSWPKTCMVTTDHSTSRSVPCPAGSTWQGTWAAAAAHQSEPLPCAQVRESGCKSHTWTDVRKSRGLGGKTYKPKSLAVCYRTEISLLKYLQTQENLSPTLFMAHPPTSHTWDTHSWQKNPWVPAGFNLTVFTKRGNGTLMRMKYVSRT